MKNSTRYFQMTPNILMEYNYRPEDKSEEKKFNWVRNTYDGCSNFILDGINFVLPINASESKFIKYDSRSSRFEITTNENQDSIKYDTFKFHFTSRNFFEGYDGIIINATINKTCIFSNLIKKTDDLSINTNPILINQKIYTTYLSFCLPKLNEMEELPIRFNVYGVKAKYDYNGDTFYITERLNSIIIPSTDKTEKLNIDINEAEDGDYFKIKANCGDKSLSDYIIDISNGNPSIYVIMYEIYVNEYTTDTSNKVRQEITHREQYIVSATNENGEIDETNLEREIWFRPILRKNNVTSFTINCEMKLLNTLDNTTIIKKSDYDCEKNPNKYGKKLNKIIDNTKDLVKINVYNKRPDVDVDSIKLVGGGSSAKIENHQHSIIGFIESANVGVTIEQIPIESIDN